MENPKEKPNIENLFDAEERFQTDPAEIKEVIEDARGRIMKEGDEDLHELLKEHDSDIIHYNQMLTGGFSKDNLPKTRERIQELIDKLENYTDNEAVRNIRSALFYLRQKDQALHGRVSKEKGNKERGGEWYEQMREKKK